MHILDQIWPFWAKNPISYGRKQKFWYPSNGKATYAPCSNRFLVCYGTKWAKNADIWPKKNNFGQNLAVYWPTILITMGVSKSFGTHKTEKPPRQLVRIVFWSGIGSNEPMPIFLPKMPVLGQIWPFLGQKSIFGGDEV